MPFFYVGKWQVQFLLFHYFSLYWYGINTTMVSLRANLYTTQDTNNRSPVIWKVVVEDELFNPVFISISCIPHMQLVAPWVKAIRYLSSEAGLAGGTNCRRLLREGLFGTQYVFLLWSVNHLELWGNVRSNISLINNGHFIR